MAYESQGKNAGQIQIHLPGHDVPRGVWDGVKRAILEKKISRFKCVVRAEVSHDGWLIVDTNAASFKEGDDLSAVLAKVEESIIHACRAGILATT